MIHMYSVPVMYMCCGLSNKFEESPSKLTPIIIRTCNKAIEATPTTSIYTNVKLVIRMYSQVRYSHPRSLS